MKIGELAKRTGCEIETIRYYEREGLLPVPPRSDGNYRLYGAQDEERVQFIRHCRSLGMSLAEVRTLQTFQAEPERACDEINSLIDRHLQQTEAQIQSLMRLRSQLQSLRQSCQAAIEGRACGILQNLESAAASNPCACHT